MTTCPQAVHDESARQEADRDPDIAIGAVKRRAHGRELAAVGHDEGVRVWTLGRAYRLRG